MVTVYVHVLPDSHNYCGSHFHYCGVLMVSWIHFQPWNNFLLGKGRGLNKITQKHIEKGGKMPKISQAIVAFQLLRLCWCVFPFSCIPTITPTVWQYSVRGEVYILLLLVLHLWQYRTPQKVPWKETKQDWFTSIIKIILSLMSEPYFRFSGYLECWLLMFY